MNPENTYEWRKQIMWGLILIVAGAAIFADRYGIFEIDELWHYWPLLLIPVGINKLIPPTKAEHVTSGLWMIFMGTWMFAIFENLYGLTFRNSWPFVLIAWGLSLVFGQIFNTRKEPGNEA